MTHQFLSRLGKAGAMIVSAATALAAGAVVVSAAPGTPVVTSVVPNSGVVAGGYQVTISGQNFQGPQSVKFGTLNATILSNNSGQIKVTAPDDSTGCTSASCPVDVTVVTNHGTSATSANDVFTYEVPAPPPAPTVTGISPTSGPASGGTAVTVTGTDFTGVQSVQFDSLPATIVDNPDSSTVDVISPDDSAGCTFGNCVAHVTVTTSNGQSQVNASDQFTYQAPCNAPSGTVVSGSHSGGTAYSQPTGSAWVQEPGSANYVASGGGATYVLGTNAVAGGWGIYKWVSGHWAALPGGLVDLAVDPSGNAWGVNSSQHIYRWTGSGWASVPGSAYDVAVGPSGTVYVLGTNSVPGGCGIYKWTGGGFVVVPGGGIQIAVGSSDYPWVINNNQTIYAWTGSGFTQESGSATMIAATAGSVWVLGTNSVPGGHGIYYFTGTGWGALSGGGTSIAVGTNRLPWVTNSSFAIYQRT